MCYLQVIPPCSEIPNPPSPLLYLWDWWCKFSHPQHATGVQLTLTKTAKRLKRALYVKLYRRWDLNQNQQVRLRKPAYEIFIQSRKGEHFLCTAWPERAKFFSGENFPLYDDYGHSAGLQPQNWQIFPPTSHIVYVYCFAHTWSSLDRSWYTQ